MVGPVHLQLFRPSVIRGPWLDQQDRGTQLQRRQRRGGLAYLNSIMATLPGTASIISTQPKPHMYLIVLTRPPAALAIWASIRINCHHLQLRNNLLQRWQWCGGLVYLKSIAASLPGTASIISTQPKPHRYLIVLARPRRPPAASAIWASIRINCHHLQLRNNLLLLHANSQVNCAKLRVSSCHSLSKDAHACSGAPLKEFEITI